MKVDCEKCKHNINRDSMTVEDFFVCDTCLQEFLRQELAKKDTSKFKIKESKDVDREAIGDTQ